MKTQLSRLFRLMMYLVVAMFLSGQETNSILVRTTQETMTIDGRMDEAAWQKADKLTDFWLWFPDDTSHAHYQTEIYMIRDAKKLYVAARCFSSGDQYIIPGLRRDFRAGGNDNISLIFDTFNDETNAFLFGLNPLGVQREALISAGGQELENFATAWDNVWEGEAQIYDGYYVCEFAIPFRTLRYNEGVNEWNFNSYRFDSQSNEQSTWNRIPRNQWIFSLAHMGKIIWEDPLPKTGANISLIPYLRGGVSQDQTKEGLDLEGNLGIDAKVAVTPGMNLDLTVNPDFSQVEVDQQLTNLTRFELSLPEQRQFFTENSDLFGSFGNARINPFFSRRIGVAIDTSTGFPVQNPIWYGARLSGKISNPLRVGLLNLQTAAVGASGIPSSNYTTAVVQHKVFSRSNVGVIFVNKQDFGKDRNSEDDFNRVIGAEYNLASANNEWNGKVFLQRSMVPGTQIQPYAHGTRMNYIGRHLNATWEHEWVGSDYTARVGFVPRHDYWRVSPKVQTFFYPEQGIINNHGPGIEWSTYWKPGFGRSDQEIMYYWEMDFRGTQTLRVGAIQSFIHLFEAFDPSRTNATPLPGDRDYRFTYFGAVYKSDQRKAAYFQLTPLFGPFYNGKLLSLDMQTSFRFQPYATLAVNGSFNRLRFPEPYASRNVVLFGPRLDLTFNKKLFLTAFFQYNDQVENININTRLQWRFKPVSDFYLVYTDNYYTDFAAKNRAVVAKLTYWLNI